MKINRFLLLAAGLSLAITFTLSCSGGDDNGGGGGISSPSGNSSSSSDPCSEELPPVAPCNNGEVTIGTQIWQKCNLNVEPSVGTSRCYCNKPENCEKYGRLYDRVTAKTVCPSDWHLPTKEDFEALLETVGGSQIAGKYLKATNGWKDGGNGLDSHGFSALPGGTSWIDNDDWFFQAGRNGYLWSASDGPNGDGSTYNLVLTSITESLVYTADNAVLNGYAHSNLFSVRCVKD
jgi:uncharacterized protein (TIGR02145 family)